MWKYPDYGLNVCILSIQELGHFYITCGLHFCEYCAKHNWRYGKISQVL